MKEKIDPKSLPLAARITNGKNLFLNQDAKMSGATYGVLSTFWRIEGLPGLYSCQSRPLNGVAFVVAAYDQCPGPGQKSKLSWSKFVRETAVEKVLGLSVK